MKLKPYLRNSLFIIGVVSVLLILLDSLLDTYNIQKDEFLIFDKIKFQDYIRGSAISLIVLFITIIIIEHYLKSFESARQIEYNKNQLKKSILLLNMSFKNYQKGIYFLLLDNNVENNPLHYDVNYPFSYLKNIFEVNNNMSTSLLRTTRLQEYTVELNNFKDELKNLYLNSHLPIDNDLFILIHDLLEKLNDNSGFKILLELHGKNEVTEFLKTTISNATVKPDLKTSNLLNPVIFLYNTINETLKFKESYILLFSRVDKENKFNSNNYFK